MRINTSRLAQAVAVGIGATVVMDSGGEVLRRTRGVKPLDYALLGRWIGHVPHGPFVHRRIAEAAPVPGERLLGWVAHYAIGVFTAVRDEPRRDRPPTKHVVDREGPGAAKDTATGTMNDWRNQP